MYAIKLNNKNNPIFAELTLTPIKDKAKAEISLEKAISGLNRIYRQVPKTDCNRCGNCCDGTRTGNPTVFSVEYWNIIKFLGSLSNKELKIRLHGAALMGKALLDKKKRQEFLEKERYFVAFCPALDPDTKSCLIYEYRPLVCRMYGLGQWYKKEALGWVKKSRRAEGEQSRYAECDQVKISQTDRTERWINAEKKSLFEQITKLSVFYYVEENKERIFNKNSMIAWMSLSN